MDRRRARAASWRVRSAFLAIRGMRAAFEADRQSARARTRARRPAARTQLHAPTRRVARSSRLRCPACRSDDALGASDCRPGVAAVQRRHAQLAPRPPGRVCQQQGRATGLPRRRQRRHVQPVRWRQLRRGRTHHAGLRCDLRRHSSLAKRTSIVMNLASPCSMRDVTAIVSKRSARACAAI